jgi:hypothetical protein
MFKPMFNPMMLKPISCSVCGACGACAACPGGIIPTSAVAVCLDCLLGAL